VSKRAEKRLAKKALKLEKILAKVARQSEEPEPSRQVVEASVIPTSKDIPDTEIKPSQRYMRWTRELEDTGGNWSWGVPRGCGDLWGAEIEPFLKQYEKKKWGEIDSERTGKGKRRRSKHCFYSYDKIIQEAFDRLVELELDDFAEQIFRFRLSGKKRIFGFRQPELFFFVWYDTQHKIYLQADD